MEGEFQLWPGVKTWLKWAHDHFEVVWLTSWAPEKIKTLLSVLYCEKFMKHLLDQPFQVRQLDELFQQCDVAQSGHMPRGGLKR